MRPRSLSLMVVAIGWVLPGSSPAEVTERLETLPDGGAAFVIGAPEFPDWTGTPARKLYQLQRSANLRDWTDTGAEVAVDSTEAPGVPVRFPLPKSPGSPAFFRLKEKLVFRFQNSETAESPSYNAQFDMFLQEFQDLTVDGFRELYGATSASPRQTTPQLPYLEGLSFDPTEAAFWKEFNTSPEEHNKGLTKDDVERRVSDFRLNEAELEVYRKNGFVVSGRLQRETFVDMFYDLWSDDLPVYISSDAILQAWHRTYLAMLEETEEVFLRPALIDLLDEMALTLPTIVEDHGDGPLAPCLKDVDLFLTMARSLVRTEIQQPVFEELAPKVRQMFDLAKQGNSIAETNLFGEPGRLTDFSQFRVRGHYENSVTLARYFQAMMWLGRIDFRLGGGSEHAPGTLRQLHAAATLSLLLAESGQLETWRQLDDTISAFVGFADFMTPEQMLQLLASENLSSFDALAKPGAVEQLQERILAGHHGEQEVFSSLIEQDCPPTKPIVLPRAFAFFGQKFVPDSWTLAKVTFDRIWENGRPVVRRMPSSVDVVFASLGNDHVTGLLADRMERTDGGVPFRDGLPYQRNLAAARATMDAQEDSFWKANLYQAWLGSLRALSDDTRSPRYPDAMRTKAWAMKTVNTQLASWTQLRHDTVLYVKQSVTPPLACEYPAGYVEPRVEFWESLVCLSEVATNSIRNLPFSEGGVVDAVRIEPDAGLKPNAILDLKPGTWPSRVHRVSQSSCREHLLAHIQHFQTVAETLGDIARTQLLGEPASEEQLAFIRDLVEAERVDYVGVRQFSGWYPRLYYRNAFYAHADHPADIWDPLITDVHTNGKDDCHGDPGGILHQAVGNPHFLLMAANHGDSRCVVAGPVFNHYEFVLPQGFRLSDSEWKLELELGSASSWLLQPGSGFTKEFLVQD